MKTRLIERRPTVKSIKVKQIDGTVNTSGLTATHQQTKSDEGAGTFGEVSTKVIDLFFFNRLDTGVFPTINETHILEWNSTDYQVVGVMQLDQLLDRLRVETERIR